MKPLSIILLLTTLALNGCGAQEEAGETPQAPAMALHTAAALGNVDAVRQHIAAGTDLNAKDAYGSTPLGVACTFGKTEVARALIDAGADHAIANSDGATPLHIAAFLCYPDIVGALLTAGADREALNNGGATALASVAGPFEDVKPIYDAIGQGLAPLGLVLDYDHIRATRPRIAEMLR